MYLLLFLFVKTGWEKIVIVVMIIKPFNTEVFTQLWADWLTGGCVSDHWASTASYIYIFGAFDSAGRRRRRRHRFTASLWVDDTRRRRPQPGANTPFMWKPRPQRVLSIRPSSGGRAIGTVRLQRDHSHPNHTHTHTPLTVTHKTPWTSSVALSLRVAEGWRGGGGIY